MVVERVHEYKDVDGELLEGVLCHPKDAETSFERLPTVLIFHAFGGCGRFEIEKAVELAKLGYVALAADVYGKGKRGKSREENYSLMMPLVENRSTTLRKRLQAAIDTAKTLGFVDGHKIVAIGFCFGGLCVLDMARQGLDVKGVVSFHGSLTPLPDAELTKINCSVQVHHGDADIHIPENIVLAFMKEMRDRDADWSFTSYANAPHAFTEPHADLLGVPGVGYNKLAADRSWEAMKNFLQEKIGN